MKSYSGICFFGPSHLQARTNSLMYLAKDVHTFSTSEGSVKKCRYNRFMLSSRVKCLSSCFCDGSRSAQVDLE